MFTNIKKQKELIDREVKLYKNERYLEVDRSIESYRSQRQREVQDIAKKCAEQLGEYEHDFHSTKKKLGIELAQLEAKNVALIEKLQKEFKNVDANLLVQKDAEIKRLNDIITLLIKEQPKHTTTLQQVK